MKKLVLSLVIGCILSASIWAIAVSSCKSCMSGHSDPSFSCHTQKSSAENMDGHSQAKADSCDMNDSGSTDCQICSHSNAPVAKIDYISIVTMDEQVLGYPVSQRNHFSNQIPPPTFVRIHSIDSLPILANHLTCLEPIRLLILNTFSSLMY